MKMTRWIAALTVAVLLMTALTGAMAEEAESYVYGLTEANVEASTIPFINTFSGERDEGEYTIYYVEGGDIPYTSINDFFAFYTELMEVMGARDAMTYTIVEPNPDSFGEHVYTVVYDYNDSRMYIDTEDNSIIFTNFNSFTQEPGSKALVTMMDLPEPEELDLTEIAEEMMNAESAEDIARLDEMIAEMMDTTEPNTLFTVVSNNFNKAGQMVELDLSNYLIDIVESEGVCYLPLQFFTDFFMSPLYELLICDGEKLMGFPYGDELYQELYENEPQEMSEEFALFNYNELRLLLDSCYGLKPEHNIDDFGEYLAGLDLIGDMVSTDPSAFDRALSKLTSTSLDDGHSGYLAPSWRSGAPGGSEILTNMEDMGASTKATFRAVGMFPIERQEAFPDGVPMYEEIDDTAIITFDGFTVLAEDMAEYYDPDLTFDPEEFVIRGGTLVQDGEVVTQEPSGPVDTIKLFLYAFQQISREDSPIKNVIIDLSNNGGGRSDAAVFVVNWILGRADIAIHDTFTGAETAMTYRADTNLDNEYGASLDSMTDLHVNVYCMVSPQSFSCGNLVPAACKMSRRVPVIGQTSGGGSCAVLPCCTASGSLFQISSPKQLSIVKNGSFYNIDQGIEPDIYLSKVSSFYDREALVEYLHQVK